MCSNNNLLPCPVCCYPIFSNFESLCVSLMTATKSPLTCPICNELFLGLEKLTVHLFSHTAAMIYAVDGNRSTTTEIVAQHDDNDSKAHETIENTSDDIALPSLTPRPPSPQNDAQEAKSLATTTTVAIDEPECCICFCKFRSTELRNMHMKLVHDIAEDITFDADANKFQCHLCTKRFKMKGSLRVHLRVVHSYGSSSETNGSNSINAHGYGGIIGKIESSRLDAELSYLHYDKQRMVDSKDGITLLDAKLWECETCSKSFTTKYFLKKHKRLHTGEMPYKCQTCNKTFTFQQSYHKHLLYHNDDKPYICNTCGRAFKELSTLHNHERIHSGEKPFKCETCDKSFRQRVSYLVHKRIHTGVMPYKCLFCDKSFRYKVSQRTHKCVGIVAAPKNETINCHSDTADILSALVKPNKMPVTDYTCDEDSTNQTLDELIAESCTKLGIGPATNVTVGSPTVDQEQHNLPSPTAELENLCIYSPIQFPDLSDLS